MFHSFGLYTNLAISTYADFQAGQERFVGTFDADAPEALMQALAPNQKLIARRVGNDILVQTRR